MGSKMTHPIRGARKNPLLKYKIGFSRTKHSETAILDSLFWNVYALPSLKIYIFE